MQKTCRKSQKNFTIRDQDLEFYKKVSPKVGETVLEIPPPDLSPDCRMQLRMNFRNERHLYRRKSDFSQNNIISIYHESSPHKVYAADEWWSDKWDGIEYGRDYDFSRPFFDQFKDLLLAVPRIGLFNVNPTNSDYCQQAYNNRNCYLCTVITECDDCMYISHTNKAVDCFDCDYVQNSQLSYGCLDSDKLYACLETQSCQNSNNLIFCYDCIGCSDCFGCFGLRKKQYHIFNQPHKKEDYEQKIKELELGKYSKMAQYATSFRQALAGAPQRESWSINTVNCTGNYLINAKDCHLCFDSFEIQDCAHCTWIFESHDIHDVYGLGGSEWLYNCLGNEKTNGGAFNTFVSDSNDVYYSDCCFYSSSLFGCAGLRSKKFCILNKEYSKEEYEALLPKIVEHMKQTGEWGQFFPASLAPFGYDESVAQEHYPLTAESAASQGFRWAGHDTSIPEAKTIAASEIPDDIADVKDEILDAAIKCEVSGKLFKIQKKELEFCRKNNIPIPRHHPDMRYAKRFSYRNPREMHTRNCGECGKQIQTTFAPDRPEKVLCEACYMAKIY